MSVPDSMRAAPVKEAALSGAGERGLVGGIFVELVGDRLVAGQGPGRQ